ncbi:TIGR03009 domain-containing protein [Lacipirellula sp.]|uniref:TIGR03009 domain-containing protein n=1 Tax=Lacipirellula sp. TaxID=2691419 RepID=UPI003D0D6884
MTLRRFFLGTTLTLSLAAPVGVAQGQQYPGTPVNGGQPGVVGAPMQQPAGTINQVAAVGVGQPGAQVGGVLGAPVAGPNGGAPVATAPNGAPMNLPPGPPFILTELEKAEVFRILDMWEKSSADVKTFNSSFERWEYDAVFGPGADIPMIKAKGTLSFSKPDKGSFKIDSISRWGKNDPQSTDVNAPGTWAPKPDEIGEHWVCDGKAVYEYSHRDKQLKVTSIPEEMRGTKIVDGPLPFLFGAEAKKLMDRYWIRQRASDPSMIWLEAHPRWPADALNYDMVDVMLDRKTMQPKAIQVKLPGGKQRHAYMFTAPKVNETGLGDWFPSLFTAPRVPFGWTRVVNEDGTAAPGGAAPQAANPNGTLELKR